jgi:hypothetical protein
MRKKHNESIMCDLMPESGAIWLFPPLPPDLGEIKKSVG